MNIDHDSEGFPKMAHMIQFLSTNELNTMASGPESGSYSNGNSGNLFLEYELDSERQRECYKTIDGTSYEMLTQIHKNKGQASNKILGSNDTSSLGVENGSQETKNSSNILHEIYDLD